ncbi:MAG: AmmeMemoRadiSam system protein B [Acidobacteriota bacterium]|nr:AmmeMemoRadiSam system protein B [Acidobacteriota bacterium]
MSSYLPRLRLSLDFVPSPDADQPGLLIRDPYQFTGTILIIPPPLVPCLACFDGEQTELDLRSSLVQATGQIQVGDMEKHLVETLSSAGFLEDDVFDHIRDARIRDFAEVPRREPSHAGSAYPDAPAETTAMLSGYMQERPAYSEQSLFGIAAPHVSPSGGAASYRDAYAALTPEYRDRTFVILGTSHYGEPDCFGLTRKPFVTPLGEAITDTALVDRLERDAPGAVRMEDYCHAIEHSIEFQVLFLQHVYGPKVKILPILCGSFAHSIYRGGKPEDNDHVRRFLDSLGEMGAREKERLFWVLGIDMAHMGRRYGDEFMARADQAEMSAVADRDRKRIDRINAGDTYGFWDLVQENQDDLKWCGSSPLYTFLKAVPNATGKLRRYQQWNIDEQSVVSFAAMTFHESA